MHCRYLFEELEHTLGALVSVQNLQKEGITGEKEERGKYTINASSQFVQCQKCLCSGRQKKGVREFHVVVVPVTVAMATGESSHKQGRCSTLLVPQ